MDGKYTAMEDTKDIYYNEFFEGKPKLSKSDMALWSKENERIKTTFVEKPAIRNLTQNDIWADRAKFYFLPFLMNCYKFTRQHRLPYFTLMCSPTCMFYRDRLHLRNFMDTIHQTFFRALDMCLKKDEKIMLLVEKRFHVDHPVDGGTQQLYNMLWDYDLTPMPSKVILPPRYANESASSRLGTQQVQEDTYPTSWDWPQLNPDVPEYGIDLCRRTCWLMDDLMFLCKRYDLEDEYTSKEIVDVSKVDEEKKGIYEKTAREFYFKVFNPKYVEDENTEVVSSDSGLLDGIDSTQVELDLEGLDSTQMGLLDSTLDFEEEDDKMNKIISFFAKIPKVTGLVQGMVDMMAALTRILPLVVVKLGDDEKLKQSLTKTVDIINLGLGKVLKICAYLGIKVQKKQSAAIGEIVKNRFKKDKKDFLEYEIDELNKSLDELENVDEEPPKPPKGQIPLDVKPNHLYPQKMPLGPKPPPPIVVPPEPPPVPVKPPPHPPKPTKPPKPPEPEVDSTQVDSSESELENGDKPNNAKPELPKIPSVKPEPAKHPPKK